MMGGGNKVDLVCLTFLGFEALSLNCLLWSLGDQGLPVGGKPTNVRLFFHGNINF